MPKYVIERDISGAGQLTAEQLQPISETSCSVLRQLGFEIQWDHSYVTGDKVYCIYRAPTEALIMEHALLAASPRTVSPDLLQSSIHPLRRADPDGVRTQTARAKGSDEALTGMGLDGHWQATIRASDERPGRTEPLSPALAVSCA